jgi:tetratricopeptide (TPR) repeat protein
MWLVCDPPQTIELRSGRRVSDALVGAVEHRVIQLRRADDFITGVASRDLMRSELAATVRLLSEAALTEEQARRILTAIGEIAQLGAWVAADGGLVDEAARYVRGGVLAARAAGNAPLAANIISTFSYQVANTGNPNEGLVLARTAYQGGRHDATPIARALLLERVAWSAARSGDLRDCERTLGLVEESFSSGPRDNDPDWIYWLNREEIDVMAGRCYTELGDARRAESLLTNAIARYDQARVRENSLYLSWLAEDYVQLGEIEHAAGIATQMAALAVRTNSARTDTRLHYIAGQLHPYRGAASVTEFFDAYQSATTPETPEPGPAT